MLKTFKHLVDSTPATIHSEEEFEDKYNINLENKSIDYPSNKFAEELKNIFTNLTDGISHNILNKFTKELIYRQIIYDEDMINYMQIIEVIIGTANPKILPHIDDEQWIRIIQLSKNYSNFTDLLKINLNSLKEVHPKEFNRAESIRYLIDEKNCEINIEDVNVKFISGLEKIYQEIDNKIKILGGLTLISILSKKLLFNSKYKRFTFNRQLTVDNSKRNIDIPWGYIFNLALKHPHNSITQKAQIKSLKDILKLSSITINAFIDVQEYNIFGHFFLDLENLIEHFRELVLYDSIFTLPQSNINLQLMLCECLFAEEDEFFKNTLNFSLKEYLTVVKYIIKFFDEDKHVFLVKVPEKLSFGLTHEKTIEILKFMSHDSNCNENYLNPSEYTEIDYFKKPLLQIDYETFLLPPIPFSAPNFYETLFEPLKEYKNEDELGKELGERLEIFIATLLKNNGIDFIRGGKYKIDGNPTECDFLIESEQSIIIIEVKKKVLTRNAKSGNDYHIFMDLSRSLLNSQYQALRLEYLLKNKGQVHLKNKDISKQIKLDKRIIKRISLTQFDFGALHNKIFIKHFFDSIFNGEFVVGEGDENLIKDFEYFTDYQMKFNSLFNKIKGSKDLNEFCMRTYFLSLDQLFAVINNSYDNDSFDKNLPNPFMISGELDWFLEYDKFNKFHNE